MSVSSRDRVQFHIEAETETEPIVSTDDRPFSIALIGDFSGAAERKPVARRKPLEIDRDNFETILERLAPIVTLPGGPLKIRSLDDFHPDSLYTRLPEFDKLRDLRERLSDPSTAKEAIREVLNDPDPAPAAAPSEGSLLDAILGGGTAATSAPKPARAQDDLADFIHNAVRPFLVDRPDARTAELLRQVDQAAAGVMRALLHLPTFQGLEAAWRTVFQLVRNLETGPDLKVWLIDISHDEFAADPLAVSQLLRESGPFAVIASLYAFGGSDIDAMTEAARIGRRCGASWLGEAALSLLDAQAAWAAFRQTPEASWLGLALPRILLRLPYGKDTSPCETFQFEESPGEPDPKRMLWANPAPFCAMLLGQAFEAQSWSMRPGAVREIGNLPVYVYKDEDGDSVAFPCAEAAVTEDAAEALTDFGIMPAVWMKNSDSVRFLRFASVAQPAAALRGPWRG